MGRESRANMRPRGSANYRAACRGKLLPAVRAILRAGHPEGPAMIQYLQNNPSALAEYRLQNGSLGTLTSNGRASEWTASTSE